MTGLEYPEGFISVLFNFLLRAHIKIIQRKIISLYFRVGSYVILPEYASVA